MSIISHFFRKSFGQSDIVRDAGLTTPADISRYDNISYGNDHKWQTLDVYRPSAAGSTPLPVIVNVHGGGWVYGNKKVYQFYCMSLAQRGFAVVNFTYRLAPENKFPAALEDTTAVFHWVLKHADKYGFDKQNVFAVGDSAGANLLGQYCAICTNPSYAAEFDFQAPNDFAPKAVALNCGQYHLDWKLIPTDLIHLLLLDYLPQKGSKKELNAINVTAHITSQFPPVFLMTANGDFLQGQAPLMAQILTEYGVPFVYRCYGDEKSILGHVFHCDIKSQAAQQCNDDECSFFRQFIGPMK